jgi:2-dehydropantoate 2-reductase
MLEVLYIAREYSYSEDVLPMKSIDDAIKITIQNYQVRPAGEVPGTPYISPNPVSGYGFPANGASASDSAPMLNMGNANFKPSMLLDIEAGRPCELEPIIGSLLDRARAKGVETPRLDVIYAA